MPEQDFGGIPVVIRKNGRRSGRLCHYLDVYGRQNGTTVQLIRISGIRLPNHGQDEQSGDWIIYDNTAYAYR